MRRIQQFQTLNISPNNKASQGSSSTAKFMVSFWAHMYLLLL